MSTRARIIAAADQLFYEQGFEHTSFADVAAEVAISRGNFYHHFKTKDDILDAVITYRLAKTQAMLAQWETDGHSPEQRICQFINILIVNRTSILAHGCPVGGLCNELVKLNHAAHGRAVDIFALFRDWLARQFAAAGRKRHAEKLALQLLSRSQGAATLANAFADESFIRSEVKDMTRWVREQLTREMPHTDPASTRNTKKG